MKATNQKRSTLRQKRFRKFLFSEIEMREREAELKTAIAPVYELWGSGTLSGAEVVALYIKNFLGVFRPRDFRGGPHGERLSASPDRLPLTVREFATVSFRSVPLAVNRALVAWAERRCELEILDHVPDALTILKRQSEGRRVVTCVFAPDKLTKFVEDARDPLGFVLHDLIHADHFFRHRDWFEGQREFYQKTLRRLEQGEFHDLLQDEKKARRFEYVIADMNSHPAHLENCLSAILVSAQI